MDAKHQLFRRRQITPDGCWEWTGSKDKGYGRITVKGVRTWVHRLAADEFGVEGSGPFVLHHCDNPACFNPEHLYRGDHAKNMRDRRERTPFNRNGGGKLTPAQKSELGQRITAGERIGDVADAFGISQSTAYRIAALTK